MPRPSEKAKLYHSGSIHLLICKEDPLPPRFGSLDESWTLIMPTATVRVSTQSGDSTLLKKDMLGILLPGFGHTLWRKDPAKPFGFSAIKIEGDVPDPLYTIFNNPPSKWREHGLATLGSNSLRQLFNIFVTELSNPKGVQLLSRELFLMLFGYELNRMTEGEKHDRVPASLNRSPLQAILEYMEAHIGDPNSVPDLAKMAKCTPDHFIRLFRDATSSTPHQYLIERRLQRAAHLLASGEKASTVSADLGFYDQSAFTRAFKSRFGIAPSRYAEETENGQQAAE